MGEIKHHHADHAAFSRRLRYVSAAAFADGHNTVAYQHGDGGVHCVGAKPVGLGEGANRGQLAAYAEFSAEDVAFQKVIKMAGVGQGVLFAHFIALHFKIKSVSHTFCTIITNSCQQQRACAREH